ncbi:hypothetical protein [Nocardia macrotermitis]|uniref:Guanylate cyclase domain-containing protein n=1 Tax=Nocardia macrotermitis TaxID=2585198 RepID=A0A7K0D1B2_9NOCA|nr:hypothetical protein [Nocardia macrotermitis]MQY19497.1 hypothetical protein [Nocardia macrotermitis]
MADEPDTHIRIHIEGGAHGPVIGGHGNRVEHHAPAAHDHETLSATKDPVAQPRQYRALLAVDIERSAGRGDTALGMIRDALQTALRESLQRSEIDWDDCSRHDLGDGMRVIVPAGIPKSRLIHPLLHELSARLRAHNRMSAELTQIRVRVALHAGEVHMAQGEEASGGPLEVLARLLDAPAARDALTQAPPTITTAAVLSQHFFEDTVGHDYPGIDDAAFHRITVRVKKFAADAWLYRPELPSPPPESPDVQPSRIVLR